MTAVVNNQMPKWAPRGRLLDAATPLATDGSNHWLEGLTLRYGGLECRTLNIVEELDACTDDGFTTTDTECLDTSAWYLPFRIYDYLGGSPLELTVDEITAAIDAGWDTTALSFAFAQRLKGYIGDAPDLLPYFTTTSAAITCCDAVAALDNQLALMLGGRQGMIHMTRGALQCCADDLELIDERWYTRNGTKVVADAGYTPLPTPYGWSAPGAMEQYMYATGEIHWAMTTPEYLDANANQTTSIRRNWFARHKEAYGLLAMGWCGVLAVLTTLDSNKVQP